jgi:hypothetical protein
MIAAIVQARQADGEVFFAIATRKPVGTFTEIRLVTVETGCIVHARRAVALIDTASQQV